MNQNAELLNFIYQNSQMGIEALQKLVSITTDSEFNKCLQSQLNEYKLINSNAVKKLNENGIEAKIIGRITKEKGVIIENNKILEVDPPERDELFNI